MEKDNNVSMEWRQVACLLSMFESLMIHLQVWIILDF